MSSCNATPVCSLPTLLAFRKMRKALQLAGQFKCIIPSSLPRSSRALYASSFDTKCKEKMFDSDTECGYNRIPGAYSSWVVPFFKHITFASEHSRPHLVYQRRPYSGGHEAKVEGSAGIYELRLSQTGEGIAECEVLQWFVREGEEVVQFQPVCEVQSDKATVEITSRYDGRILRTHFSPGDIVKVGETLCDVLPSGVEMPAAAAPPPAPDVPAANEHSGREAHLAASSPSAPPSGKLLGETLATPAVRHLAKSYGIELTELAGTGHRGRVLKEDVLRHAASLETAREDAANMEAALEGPSPPGEDRAEPIRGVRDVASSSVAAGGDGAAVAAESVAGSREEDSWPLAEKAARRTHEAPPSASQLQQQAGADHVIPIRGFRRTMARTMAAATAVPHFNLMEEVNVDALIALRSTLREAATREGVERLTHLPLVVKALSRALLQHPQLNSTVDAHVTEVTCRASHNIGIAMATPNGLVVPNIKDCQTLSVLQIAMELARLRQLAAENKLATEDVTDGTITVSNVGMYGGTYAGPILNLPEVAIVALGMVQKLPRLDSLGQVSWAADHRVLDGAALAAFCRDWKALLQSPELLLLHLK
eukprot:jgi/Mesen1/9456/ME000627S08846